METSSNSYSVQEDEVLWELHEIRHILHAELKTIRLISAWKANEPQRRRYESRF